MLDLEFHASANDGSTFEAKSALPGGTIFTLTGRCEFEIDGRICYVLQMHHKHGENDDKAFRGYLDGNSLKGKWGAASGDIVNPFVFKRVTPQVMCCWPSPADFKENKARALWQFAITAVRNQVLRSKFSWTLLKSRRDNRKNYISLLLQQRIAPEHQAALAKIRHSLTHADACCYYWMADYLQRTNPKHL